MFRLKDHHEDGFLVPPYPTHDVQRMEDSLHALYPPFIYPCAYLGANKPFMGLNAIIRFKERRLSAYEI